MYRSRKPNDRQEPETVDWRDRVHDLKNPLSAILANCQYLIVHGGLTGDSHEVVSDIEASARALRDMLDESQNGMVANSAAGRAKK
jgi:phospho-acceptor domain-containing protein